jgi:hypothetical protein
VILARTRRINNLLRSDQEIAERRHRFRIASVMGFVAIAAFDLAVIRTLGDYRCQTGDQLVGGGLQTPRPCRLGVGGSTR